MPPLIEPVVLQPLIMANDLGVDGLHRTGLERRSFARIQDAIDVPTLIETQINSFDWFRKEGLRELFDEISPITDFTGKNMELRFLDYVFGEPRYDEYECRERDMTYAAPLRVNVQLHILATGELKESEIFLGDFPLMTENGTFVINGAERVVVSQLIRSPGVYFKEEKDPTSGRGLHSAKLIPNRGAWLEFETNKRDVISVKVDRKRKIPVTILLRAVLAWQAQANGEGHWVPDNELEHKGHDEDVLELFQHMDQTDHQYIKVTLDKDPARHSKEALMELYKRLRPGDPPTLDNARSLLESLLFSSRRYDLAKVGRYKLNKNLWEKDPRPEARANAPDAKVRVLRPDDIYKIVERLIDLNNGKGSADDIDHLGNRRVRTVGELIQQQFRVGLLRMERVVKERMSLQDPDTATPNALVNIRPVVAAMREFFGGSQLSQFMDQTNPLAELTNKRRLSALGPGGLSRDRAGFEVRDVHHSHYGRICPVETPEGPNIGLITSLSTYARINDLGFIETPYRLVKGGKVTNEIRWLSASDEEDYTVAQANAVLNQDGTFGEQLVLCRKGDDYPLLPPDRIDFMDVAPEQLVSIAAALIPFLEHDDANRALMGSNMQRQSVPLLFPQAPLVGTGLEEKVARDSGAVVIAKRAGVVTRVTADEIIVDAGPAERPTQDRRGDDRPLARLTQQDRYKLRKYWRTNQDTAINQRPLVRLGQRVKMGDVLADGAGTEMGQLALGANVTVAFMPWYGHNFEDAIVLSERLVKDDVYSSIHIQELELHVRDTKRGQEEITREIPNVAEESLVDLDERGIVRIGAHVKPGDILVGKITPKGETELSPEEKLLTAIFGEKAKDVKDSSLKVPPGMAGVVIDVKIFSRIEDQVVEKDRGERIGEVRRIENDEKARISAVMLDELTHLLDGQEVALMLKAGTVEEYLPAGTRLSRAQLQDLELADVDLKTLRVANKAANERIRAAIDMAARERAKVEEKAEDQIDRILQPDELPPGVIQLVKVYLAEKRKISVGDKMAGRHGNKGIVARIVPEEDMPFLPDGTPVDIVLNPLGVPSRMNVGQILETHLGWALHAKGETAATAVYDGATEEQIRTELKEARHMVYGVEEALPSDGKIEL